MCQSTVFYGLPEDLARSQMRQLSDFAATMGARMNPVIADAPDGELVLQMECAPERNKGLP